MIAQLACLGNAVNPDDPMAARYFYILNSLAEIKTCVILTELAHQSVDGAADQLVHMFATLLGAVRAEHPAAIRENVTELLVACLVECDPIDHALLEPVLICLLPAARQENAAQYQVAHELLHRCREQAFSAVGSYVKVRVCGRGGGGGVAAAAAVLPSPTL